jgi:hypothetical protein
MKQEQKIIQIAPYLDTSKSGDGNPEEKSSPNPDEKKAILEVEETILDLVNELNLLSTSLNNTSLASSAP